MPHQRSFAVVALAAGALTLGAGCGGGARQDAGEPSGDFKLAVVHASFPRAQGLADTSPLRITVRNDGTATVPDVALTVDGISTASATVANADTERPVWIVNDGPQGGGTAYVNTWALGPLRANQQRTFTWSLTAIRAGTHTLRYRAAAGLNGKARAVAGSSGGLDGSITVKVTRRARNTAVDPKTGAVVAAGSLLPSP